MSKKRRRYELERRIGKGGMGEVFRAVCRGALGFRAPVAIKRLPDAKAKDFDARLMLQQEATLCATLEHPNIVPVVDFDQDSQGDVRLVMMYVDGVDLDALIDSGELPIEVTVYIVSSVLCGLSYIHKRSIIHRDITPGNILVSRAGAVKIADFGLATCIEQANLAAIHSGGTVGFMSPEAIRNDSLDPRSDLFSLGAVLYRLLTGTLPFPAKDTQQRMAQTLCQTPEPPHRVCPQVPRALSDITMRLLAPDREDRFASAIEVLDALPVSKYGSEDLAALLEERHEQGRLRLPSTQHGPSSDRAGENGAESSEDLPRRTTMVAPRPGIILDPDTVAQALAETHAIPRRVSPERALEDLETPREAIEAPTPRKDAIHAPKAPRRARLHPWLRVYFALMAVGSVVVWGTLGMRAVRSHRQDPPTHAPRDVAAMDRADSTTEAPGSPGPSRGVERTPAPQPRPIAGSDENNTRNVPTRKRAEQTRSRRPRTRESRADQSEAWIAPTEPKEDETKPMDTPETWASSIEDPTAVNPFERFAGPMTEKLPGEAVMQP